MRRKKKLDRFYQSLLFVCFVGEWNPEMTSQSKLDPFSFIVVHGPKSAQLPCFEGALHLKETCKAKNFFAIVNRPVAKAYLCEKEIGRLVALRSKWKCRAKEWSLCSKSASKITSYAISVTALHTGTPLLRSKAVWTGRFNLPDVRSELTIFELQKLNYLDWKRSSGWLESWEGLLLVTDVSTTCAEAILRVKWWC